MLGVLVYVRATVRGGVRVMGAPHQTKPQKKKKKKKKSTSAWTASAGDQSSKGYMIVVVVGVPYFCVWVLW